MMPIAREGYFLVVKNESISVIGFLDECVVLVNRLALDKFYHTPNLGGVFGIPWVPKSAGWIW
jgi:hypothetical protein